jgi:hypothetical protein
MLYADFVGMTGSPADVVAIYREVLARTDLSAQQAAVAANNLAVHLAEPETAAEAEKLVATAMAEMGPHPDVLDTRGIVRLAGPPALAAPPRSSFLRNSIFRAATPNPNPRSSLGTER